ncbi:MAG: kelch repeat-containing protein, partial [Myxococcales bacterium]
AVVEIYRFATSTWQPVAPMPVGRIQFGAVGLPDGKRIVALGGHRVTSENALAPVDTLDLTTDTWTTTGALKQGRTVVTATLLPDGKILVAGGVPKPQIAIPLGTAEVYDPATGGTATSVPDLLTARLGHTAHRVTVGGKSVVLLVGGLTASSEVFDPDKKTWSGVGPMAAARGLMSSVLLPDGSVLALGGIDSGGTVYSEAERFDPATLTWKKTQPMASPRYSLQAVTLADGRVLIAGGTPTYFTGTTTVPTVELFDPIAVGQPCAGPGDCQSLQCVDGVCCATACDGVCEACVGARTGGADGTCAPVIAGQDPDDECAGQEPASCGRVGTCDGAGQCARFAAGTLCGAATCAAGVGNERRCDGAGACQEKVSACAPYRCKDPTACATDCDTDEACDAAAHCTAKQCVDDLATGSACTRAAECTSGQCVDGVCCESACQGACVACAQALTQDGSPDGQCRPARSGLDPHGTCVESPVASCGRNGLCDGLGGCAFYPAGTSCQSAACASDGAGLRSERHECDGAGTCAALPQPCGLFGCSGGDCRTTCADDTDCLDTAFCQGGACVARREAEQEQSCAAGNQCLSGFCVDGFCCNTPCQGSCEACDAPGARGSCVAVAGEPHGGRDACPEAPAGQPCQQRVCDGATRASCAGFVGPAVTCREPSCAQAVATPEGRCDGQGACPEAAGTRCEPFVCRGTACLTLAPGCPAGDPTCAGCTGDADCRPSFRCDLASRDCIPRTVALCDGNDTLINPNGSRTPCAPYTCEGSVCKNECASVLDCVLPSVCDVDSHACVPPRPNPDDG